MQRWDDHRYYHHSRINQSLHLVSALELRVRLRLLFVDPAWPRCSAGCVVDDHAPGRPLLLRAARATTTSTRRPTSTRKRSRSATTCAARSCCSSAVGAGAAGAAGSTATLLRPVRRRRSARRLVHDVGMVWLALGVGGLLFRTVQLFVIARRADRRWSWMTEDPHRPVPRHQALLEGAAAPAARRADRPDATGASAASQLRAVARSISRRMPRRIDAVGQRRRRATTSRRRSIARAAATKRSRDRLEVGVGVVEAEDQAPGADPAQRQPSRAGSTAASSCSATAACRARSRSIDRLATCTGRPLAPALG